MKAARSRFFLLIGTLLYIHWASKGAADPSMRYASLDQKHCHSIHRATQDELPELYHSIDPTKRDWSLINGIAAYESGFLSNFFKAHEKIEELAEQIGASIEDVAESLAYYYLPQCIDDSFHSTNGITLKSALPIAIDLEDPYQFFQHHFDLLKHLFFVQESERILKVAQGTRTFAHHVNQNKFDNHNFIEIMAQIVAYGIAYTHNVSQKKPIIRAIHAVESELRSVRRSSAHQLAILSQHAAANKSLDEEKAREFEAIKKEFDIKIHHASVQERPAIIAQKKQKEQLIAQQIAQKKDTQTSNSQIRDALNLVPNTKKKLQDTVDAGIHVHNRSVAECIEPEQNKKIVARTAQIVLEQDKKAINHAIKNVLLLNLNEEHARVIEALKTAVRGNLCVVRTDIVSHFDKKAAEFVRNFVAVLESALIEEFDKVPGLAAKMIMAFVYSRSADACDKPSLYRHLYDAITKRDPLFINGNPLVINTDMHMPRLDATPEIDGVETSLPIPSLDAVSDALLPADSNLTARKNNGSGHIDEDLITHPIKSNDSALINIITHTTKTGLGNLDSSYQSLVRQLLAYGKRSEIVHPYCVYKKSNFTIITKKEGKKENDEHAHQVCFPDCVESTLRNLIGELISNGNTFDCAALDALGATQAVQQYFRNFSSTYHDCQTFKARNEWANVVAGYEGVEYKQPEYACTVKATVKNFLYMFNCLFEPGRILKKPFDMLTLDDIASIFTTLCDQMNSYFHGTKNIQLAQITAFRDDELLPSHVPMLNNDYNMRMVFEFIVSKKNSESTEDHDITQKIVVTIMECHAIFDVHKVDAHKVAGKVQSAAHDAIIQLHQFLYTDSLVNYQLRNDLLDLMTELGFNGAIKQVQESLMMKGETCAPLNYEEQALSQARCLLYLIPNQQMAQRVVKYLACL